MILNKKLILGLSDFMKNDIILCIEIPVVIDYFVSLTPKSD